MRINNEKQTVDMEERDWNYLMPAYLRSYLFHMKNSPPTEIVFPMFKTVTWTGITVPVRYVDPDSPAAKEIKDDGSAIPEATEAEIAKIDEEEKPPVVAQLEEAAKEIVTPTPEDLTRQQDEAAPEETSAAKAAFAGTTGDYVPTDEEVTAGLAPPPIPTETAKSEATQKPPEPKVAPPDRKPNQPAHPIPPGQPLDNMTPRDKADLRRVAKDLKQEPDIADDEEDSKGHKGKEGDVGDIEVR